MTWGDTFSEMSSAINCAEPGVQSGPVMTPPPRVIVRCHNNNQLKQREEWTHWPGSGQVRQCLLKIQLKVDIIPRI